MFLELSSCVKGYESEYPFSVITPTNPNTLKLMNPETHLRIRKNLL